MTLTKSQIVDTMTDHMGISKKTGTESLETLLEIIKSALEKGEDVLISGYGKFCVKEKKSRRGRNPATGQDMLLEKRKVVVFRCSHILREKINGD
jgi:integration host factor subunit alpha